MFRRWMLAAAVAALIVSPAALADTYTLTVEPSYPNAQAQEVYKPLLDYLKRSTGHTFNLQIARSYHYHWRDLREAAPTDFAFEDAHFVDYRIGHQGFVPMVRSAEPASYVLLADPQYEDRGIKSLIGLPVACMPAPSLGFALLTQMYDNPVAQPEVKSEAATWRDGLQMIFSGDAQGAFVPASYADIYPNLVVLGRTEELPGSAFTASPNLPEAVRQSVTDALLALHEDAAMYDVLAELGVSRFVPATRAEYAGQEAILSSFFGYKPVKTTVE
jgi:hypothetical protein